MDHKDAQFLVEHELPPPKVNAHESNDHASFSNIANTNASSTHNESSSSPINSNKISLLRQSPQEISDINAVRVSLRERRGRRYEDLVNPYARIHYLYGSVDSTSDSREKIAKIEHDIEEHRVIGRREYTRWHPAITEVIVREKPAVIAIRGLSPDASLAELIYNLPDNPGSLRDAVGKNLFILGTDFTRDLGNDELFRKAFLQFREGLSFDWDDPRHEYWKTKFENLIKGPGSPQLIWGVVKWGYRILRFKSLPFLPPLPFLGKEIAKRAHLRMPAGATHFSHRVGHLFFPTHDLDFQHSLMGVKIREAQEYLACRNLLQGKTFALIPLHEAKTQHLLNNPEKQEEILKMRFTEFFSQIKLQAEQDGITLAPEYIDFICKMLIAVVGRISIKQILPMDESVSVGTAQKNIVDLLQKDDEYSSTITNLIYQAREAVFHQEMEKDNQENL
ncbi:MAG: hypothetical protein KatS3mg089_0694 [Patescibacteria group bacterium]|nr:MAG: hypothetical protein KatS3mg089_0694 [Patescibacteria group bacterium]